MDRSEEYKQGYRAATKDAVTWLHERAKLMRDAHAIDVLNTTAFHYGQEAKRKVEED